MNLFEGSAAMVKETYVATCITAAVYLAKLSRLIEAKLLCCLLTRESQKGDFTCKSAIHIRRCFDKCRNMLSFDSEENQRVTDSKQRVM